MVTGRFTECCGSCLVGWKNFRNLTPGELDLVNKNRSQATFKPGQIIIKQGSPASQAVFLASGLAKSFFEGPGNKNYLLEILMPSSIIIGPGVLVHPKHTFSLTALTIVDICFISLEIIDRLIRTNAEFASGMIKCMSEKSYVAQQRLISIQRKRMDGRIAEAILFFANEVNKSESFRLILTRQELGEMTHMTKESVVRILKELDTSGIIRSEGTRITILDSGKLKMISEKG